MTAPTRRRPTRTELDEARFLAERARSAPALLRQMADALEASEPRRAPAYSLASRLQWSASDLLEAAESIAQTLCASGDHKPRRHGDGSQPWCDGCGRGRYGDVVSTDGMGEEQPELRQDRVEVTCNICHQEVPAYREGHVDRARVRTHSGKNRGRGAGQRCLGSGQLAPVREQDRGR